MTTVLQQTAFVLCSLLMLDCGHRPGSVAENNQTDSNAGALKSEVETEVVPRSFPNKVEILLPTQYRKESTGYPKAVKDKDWFELYQEGNTQNWKIGKALISISYGRDECVGEDVMIIKSLNENAVLFFTGFEGLSQEPVTILADSTLFPDRDLSFDFEGREYRLSPRGSCMDGNNRLMTGAQLRAMTNADLEHNIKISGYQLFFGTGDKSFRIAAIESMDWATPRIIWAGDLNDDGLPDLILDLSAFNESQHLYFYLSDKYDPVRPLKKLADLQVVNDC